MSTIRRIKKVLKSQPTLEGAGVHLRRAFGWHHVPELDPFLLLDDFRSDNPDHYLAGFPWHPHRGIETITYVLEGTVEHGDSMGNRGVIGPGDVQWMTAGSGIVHQEMPKGDRRGRMGGFQLWANLPASHKMMDPRYRDVQRADIPDARLESGASVRVICGEVDGTRGPVRDIVTDPEYLDVSLPPRSRFARRIRRGYTAFAYVIEGAGRFEPDGDPFRYEVEGRGWFDMKRERTIGSENLVVWDDGDEIAVETDDEPARFLLVSGRPIGEPVAWRGPIVMNTQEELRVAFDEYERGTFLKHSKP
ncbi:MAG: pirin family protein [Candidatus Latescibacterota bacterium]|jgi:redox-sensitive bicupin YhaK (pirin superfamily)|nr:MAG: pirin family protein [Candidatus Latescibacterota bacterium]